jgi:hypothetical protein
MTDHLYRLLAAVRTAPPSRLLFLPDRTPLAQPTPKAIAEMLATVDRRRGRT